MTVPAPPVRQKVEAIAGLDRAAEQLVGRHQRVVESFMAQLGRPRTLFAFLMLVAGWVGVNALLPRLRWDPPPFFWLQGLLTFFSVTTTSVVLITQHRWVRRAEQRAQLDLHINLLAEAKIAKLVALLEELRRDLPSVHDRPDPEAAAMSRGTDAAEVMDELARSLDQAEQAGQGPEPGAASRSPRSD